MDYWETMGNTSESPRMKHFTQQFRGIYLQNNRWTHVMPNLTLNQIVA